MSRPARRPDSDEGLQAERTMLAWRRTATAFLVAAAVGARLLVPALGGWAYPAVAVPALCAFVVATARHVEPVRRAPAPGSPAVTPRPGWLAALAALSCLSGLAAAATVLTGTR
ncbi:MAG TPA: DUF202 domain-containing protein [Micromonospora sp.]